MSLPSGNPFKCHKSFCICSLLSHLNVLTFFPPYWGMLRRSRRGAGSDRGAGASPASNAANPPAAGAGAGVASISAISAPTPHCASLVCGCQSSPVFWGFCVLRGFVDGFTRRFEHCTNSREPLFTTSCCNTSIATWSTPSKPPHKKPFLEVYYSSCCGFWLWSCMHVSSPHIARVWINRVRLPILLLVVS